MDRRQQKTRAAIISAFTALLAEKSYGKITVQQIIDAANVGRTTFYAHFETKDDLLRTVCEELFAHIVGSASDCGHTHGLYADGSAPESVFCHLLHHLQEDDGNILEILSSESGELFLRYFKDSLNELVRDQVVGRLGEGAPEVAGSSGAQRVSDPLGSTGAQRVPEDFLVNHVSSSFVEMVLWWLKGGMRQTPEELDGYFRAVIEPIL